MRVLIALMMFLECGLAAAATCNSASSGTWFLAGRWSCGHIPVAADDVFILNTHTVSIDTANAVAQAVTVNNGGILQFNSTTARTLTVSRAGSGTGTGNVTVSTTGTFTVANVTQSGHVLRLDGNLTNNGTFNMAVDGNSRALVEFNRNGAQTLTGTGGTTNFQQIRLNMTSTANILDVTALSNLTFTNGTAPFITPVGAGTFRLSSPLTLTNVLNNSLAANLRVWVNNAGATLSNTGTLTIVAGGILQVNSGIFSGGTNLTLNGTMQVNGGASTVTGNVTTAGDLEVNGGTLDVNGGTGITLNAGGSMLVTAGTTTVLDEIIINGGSMQINAGAVDVGDAANERVVLQQVAGSTFTMNGGTLDISGRFTSNNAVGGDSFTMTNGTLTVGLVGNTTNTAQGGLFYVGSGTQFNMSGGTIVLQSDNTAANARGYDVNAVSSTVTGGTVQIGNNATVAAEIFQINSVPPIGNLTIQNNAGLTSDPTAVLVNPSTLSVVGNLTIGTQTVLNSASQPINVAGNWVNNGSFTQGTGTVTLNGGSAQTIGGTTNPTIFNNLSIANTLGGVSLTQNQTVGATLTLTSGTFAVGANTLTLNGPTIAGTPTNLATTAASSLVFGGSTAGINLPSSVLNLNNLTVNNTAATTQAALTLNSGPTVAGAITLTSGIIDTGSNTLTASASCATPSVTRTSGWVSGNLRMAFPLAGPPNCIFHLGDPAGAATFYSPMRLQFTAISAAGSITASERNEDHRNTAAGSSGIDSTKSVNKYWSLKSSTVAGTATATWTYVVGDNDGGTTPGNYRIRRGTKCSGTLESRTCTPWSSLTASGTTPPTNISTITVPSGVTISADSPAEADFSIGEPDPSTNFLREKQFIYTRELY